ncbi:MAG: pyridoxamine 5'-phosphate oxidase family protein [Litorimonas sp.]
MADLKDFETRPRVQLLEEIKGARCVMLGSPSADEHMQPMAPQIDKASIESVAAGEDSVIYFFSDNMSDLGRAVLAQPGARVMATHIGKDYQACVEGALSPASDPAALIERFWNPIAASWYPGGQDDPKMLMLEFRPVEAAVWASTGNPLKFVFETAKANLTDTRPDLGKSKVIDV